MKGKKLNQKKKGLNNYNTENNKKRYSMKKDDCDFCKGELAGTKDIVMSGGKSVPINVQECKKCGETFSSLKEAEKVRKELHPSFWEKIKNLFVPSSTKEIGFFKGKVL